jgi:hypothetical protein
MTSTENPHGDAYAAQPSGATPPASAPDTQPQQTVQQVYVPAQRPADPRAKSPALAMILSAMPGLGQIYVGYYQRGFVHALVIAGAITMITILAGSRGSQPLIPLFAMFLAFFFLYNIIDAGRRASLYNQVLAGSKSIEMPKDFAMPAFRGSIFGGLLLIGIGVILLLNTRWEISLEWIGEWWPVMLMIFGAYLLVRAVQERSVTSKSERAE